MGHSGHAACTGEQLQCEDSDDPRTLRFFDADFSVARRVSGEGPGACDSTLQSLKVHRSQVAIYLSRDLFSSSLLWGRPFFPQKELGAVGAM